MECMFWFGLALTQWKCGRLVPQVKEKALELIDSGADAKHWAELGAKPKDLAKRKTVVEKLRQQLVSEMPPRKKVKPVYHAVSPWPVGEVVAFQFTKEADAQEYYGKWIAFHVSYFWKDLECLYIRFFDWIGDDTPTNEALTPISYVDYYSVEVDGIIVSSALGLLCESEQKMNSFLKKTVSLGSLPVSHMCPRTRCGFEFLHEADKQFSKLLRENGVQSKLT